MTRPCIVVNWQSRALLAGNETDGKPVTQSNLSLRAPEQVAYVAPPGRHLLMPAGVVEFSSGPRMNRTRPAVDAMFASASRWFGDRVVAVVLSGMLDDGAVSAALVEQAGGLVVVQRPQAASPAETLRAQMRDPQS
jgi:two-component system chemotaxis response regulator CheB